MHLDTNWKITARTQSHGGVVQIIFRFNLLMFGFRVNSPGCRRLTVKNGFPLKFNMSPQQTHIHHLLCPKGFNMEAETKL